jgi:hypothetical protein
VKCIQKVEKVVHGIGASVCVVNSFANMKKKSIKILNQAYKYFLNKGSLNPWQTIVWRKRLIMLLYKQFATKYM